jgi:hypothetical protein
MEEGLDEVRVFASASGFECADAAPTAPQPYAVTR